MAHFPRVRRKCTSRCLRGGAAQAAQDYPPSESTTCFAMCHPVASERCLVSVDIQEVEPTAQRWRTWRGRDGSHGDGADGGGDDAEGGDGHRMATDTEMMQTELGSGWSFSQPFDLTGWGLVKRLPRPQFPRPVLAHKVHRPGRGEGRWPSGRGARRG